VNISVELREAFATHQKAETILKDYTNDKLHKENSNDGFAVIIDNRST